MKTIQFTIDEPLLDEVDRVSQELLTSRSAFIRAALRAALRRHLASQLEKKHEQGYQKHPAKSGEFDIWQDEQSWGV